MKCIILLIWHFLLLLRSTITETLSISGGSEKFPLREKGFEIMSELNVKNCADRTSQCSLFVNKQRHTPYEGIHSTVTERKSLLSISSGCGPKIRFCAKITDINNISANVREVFQIFPLQFSQDS